MTVIRNRGTSGDGLNGTNAGLVKVEGPAIWMPGPDHAFNYLIQTSGVAPALTTEAEIIVRVFNDWSVGEATNERIVAAPGPWDFYKNNANPGQLIFAVDDATGQVSHFSSVSLPDVIADGDWAWIRVTWMADDGGGVNSECRFWFAPDQASIPTSWTPVGIVRNARAMTALDAPSNPLSIGNYTGATERQFKGGMSRVIVREAIDGTAVVDFDASTDIVLPEATSMALSVGPLMTVTRAASGPVTTLVPAGKTVLINPDDTDAANQLVTAESPDFVVAAGEDFMCAWVGQSPDGGGAKVSGRRVFSSKRDGSNALWIEDDRPSVDQMQSSYHDGTTRSASMEPLTGVTDHEALVIMQVFDVAASEQRGYVFNSSGLVDNAIHTGQVKAEIASSGGAAVMPECPGSVSAVMFRKGVGIAAEYDDVTLAALAAYLLAEL
jgi:hypothetical protein